MGGDGRGNLRVAKADNDAARRVATSFEDWENRIEAAVFGAQCGSQMISPQRPTVGAGSSQREDSPARPLPVSPAIGTASLSPVLSAPRWWLPPCGGCRLPPRG